LGGEEEVERFDAVWEVFVGELLRRRGGRREGKLRRGSRLRKRRKIKLTAEELTKVKMRLTILVGGLAPSA